MDETTEENLTRAQRKKLIRQEVQQERSLENQKKQRAKKLKNYIALSLVVLALAGFLYWKLIPPKNAPILELVPDEYNFGSVSQAAGVVASTMTLTNKGNEDLVINNIETSCGCTSASLIYQGIESPRFGMAMHGTNPKNFEQIIPPGDTAKLQVYYDPNVHKDLRGSIARSIFIYSNDPRNRKQEVKITAIQTA